MLARASSSRNASADRINKTTWSGGRLIPKGGGHFIGGTNELKFTFDKDGKPMSAESVGDDGAVMRFAAEREWTPTPAELASFEGDWFSDEAAATFTVAIEADKAFMKQRPATRVPMQPLYKDHFAAQGFVVWFTRDNAGKVTRMHVGASRMRDMPFVRVK